MASYTLPNIVTGGQITVQGNSLADAQQNAANQTGVSLSAQQGGGTFGSNTNSSIGGGSSPSAPPATVQAQTSALGAGINSLLGAIASGNKQAFDEAVRQFNQTFGLEQSKFQESVRQYNENLGVTQAGLTGTYQGQQTQQAQLQAFNQALAQAGVTGQYQPFTPGMYLGDPANGAVFAVDPNGQPRYVSDPAQIPRGTQVQNVPGLTASLGGVLGTNPVGQQTLASQQQQFSQQLAAINAAAALQANPFRQQQVIGQLGRILGGQGVAGFSAPQTVSGVGTAGGNTQGGMGYMSQLISDIQGGSGAQNGTDVNSVLAGIPTPNKINSADFLRAAPSTQNMILQGMQEKYGLDPNDSLQQIKNTLPAFQAPSTFGQIRG